MRLEVLHRHRICLARIHLCVLLSWTWVFPCWRRVGVLIGGELSFVSCEDGGVGGAELGDWRLAVMVTRIVGGVVGVWGRRRMAGRGILGRVRLVVGVARGRETGLPSFSVTATPDYGGYKHGDENNAANSRADADAGFCARGEA